MLKKLVMVVSDRRARQFMNNGAGAVSKDFLDVVGYGVFAGQKE